MPSKDTFRAATDSYEQWRARRIQIVADDLALKHARFSESPFLLLRGAVYRFHQQFRRLLPELAAVPAVVAVGDLHVENFGTWRDQDSRLVWGSPTSTRSTCCHTRSTSPSRNAHRSAVCRARSRRSAASPPIRGGARAGSGCCVRSHRTSAGWSSGGCGRRHDGLALLHSMGEEAANVHLVPAPAGAAPKTLRRDDEARGTDWLAPAAEQIVAAVGADFSEWCN